MARVTAQQVYWLPTGSLGCGMPLNCCHLWCGAEGLLHLHQSPGTRPAATSAKVAEDLSSADGVNSP